MPLLRATPSTAIPTACQLAADLGRWVREAGQLAAAPSLGDVIGRLPAACREPRIDIELLLDPALASDALGQIAQQLSPSVDGAALTAAADQRTAVEWTSRGGLHVRLTAHRLPERRVHQAGTLRPPIVVIAAAENSSSATLEETVAAASDRPVVVVVGGGGLDRAAQATAWHVERLPTGDPASLESRLEAPPLAALHDVLRADSACRALDSLANVFAQALEQELRSVKAKRTIVQQAANRLQPRAPVVAGADLVSDLRGRLQRHFADFTRGVQDRADAAFAPLVGTIWKSMDAELANIEKLEYERRSKAHRLKLPDETEQLWLESLGNAIEKHAGADLVAMRDFFRLVQRDIESAIETAGGPPVTPQFQFLPDERLHRLLEMHLAIQRRYSAEIPRPGLFEYAMIARRYQMVLFMFISAFGLSFLRTYREFMLPTAINLLSFGAMNVFNSVRRERVETKHKELDRAREALRGEARRILTEIQRGWVSALGQHLTEQVAVTTGQLESTIRDHLARQAQTTGQERQRIQRQLQGFEMTERKLQGPIKGRDVVAAAIAQFRGELRQLFATSMRPPIRQA